MPLLQADRSPYTQLSLRKWGTDDQSADVIRHVTLVGALLDQNDSSRLDDGDDYHLRHVIGAGHAQGMRFAFNLQVQVCNLSYGDDFLASPPATQCAVFCYIYYYPDDVAGACGFFSQSRNAALKDAWHQALVRSGADWAVNIHGWDCAELPTGLLARDPYRLAHVGRRSLQFDFLRRMPV